MQPKLKISVYREKKGLIYDDYKTEPVLAIIKRVLKAEQIGNFNPLFCRYKGVKTLIQSFKGDISDPYRRDESYKDTLYITV